MINNVGSTSSVGDTIPQFTISIEQRQLELVTLNTIFSVVKHGTTWVSFVINATTDTRCSTYIAIVCFQCFRIQAHSIVSPRKVRTSGTRLFVVVVVVAAADQSGVHLSCNVSIEAHATPIFPAALGTEQLQNPVKSAQEYTRLICGNIQSMAGLIS